MKPSWISPSYPSQRLQRAQLLQAQRGLLVMMHSRATAKSRFQNVNQVSCAKMRSKILCNSETQKAFPEHLPATRHSIINKNKIVIWSNKSGEAQQGKRRVIKDRGGMTQKASEMLLSGQKKNLVAKGEKHHQNRLRWLKTPFKNRLSQISLTFH